jgi:uncharacterized membrane protein YkoI
MLRSKSIPALLAAVLLFSTAAGIAQARDHEHGGQNAEERAAILSAKTSLAQAIATAEQETGGKAIDAGIENEDGNTAFEVKIVKGDAVQKVLIDPQTGKVMKVAAAGAKHGGDEHEDKD